MAVVGGFRGLHGCSRRNGSYNVLMDTFINERKLLFTTPVLFACFVLLRLPHCKRGLSVCYNKKHVMPGLRGLGFRESDSLWPTTRS